MCNIYLLKILIAAATIVAVTETSKFNTLLGALIKSLPLISVISLTWLYIETKDTARIAALSSGTFWLVIPTLPMFYVLPLLLKNAVHFYLSLGLCVLLTIVCYTITLKVLNFYGVSL